MRASRVKEALQRFGAQVLVICRLGLCSWPLGSNTKFRESKWGKRKKESFCPDVITITEALLTYLWVLLFFSMAW